MYVPLIGTPCYYVVSIASDGALTYGRNAPTRLEDTYAALSNDENVVYDERRTSTATPWTSGSVRDNRVEAPAAVDEDENVEAFRADIVFPRALEYSPGRVFALTAQPRGARVCRSCNLEGRRKRREPREARQPARRYFESFIIL